jgi:hypothetical protein
VPVPIDWDPVNYYLYLPDGPFSVLNPYVRDHRTPAVSLPAIYTEGDQQAIASTQTAVQTLLSTLQSIQVLLQATQAKPGV